MPPQWHVTSARPPRGAERAGRPMDDPVDVREADPAPSHQTSEKTLPGGIFTEASKIRSTSFPSWPIALEGVARPSDFGLRDRSGKMGASTRLRLVLQYCLQPGGEFAVARHSNGAIIRRQDMEASRYGACRDGGTTGAHGNVDVAL